MANWTTPLLYFSMDNATVSGSTITDLGSGSHNGTLNGSPTSAQGQIGQAMSFTAASSQYINGATVGNYPVWSIAAWINYSGAQSNDACIFTDIFTSAHVQYCMGFGTDLNGGTNEIGVGFYNSGWSAVSATISASTWTHCIGTYDGTTLKLFVNGSLVNSTSVTATPGTDGSGFRVGRRWDSGVYYSGLIDEVRFYNFALGTSDIAALYAFNGWYGFGNMAAIR